MKQLTDFINEELNGAYMNQINEGEVSDEKSFREYAENKFREVFGDDTDEDEMKKVIDGIVKDCDGDWGEAVGMLNKSFGS